MSRHGADGGEKHPLELLRRAGVNPREASFPDEQRFDRAGFLGRVSSSSHVVHGVTDRAGFVAALDVLFDRHAQDGVLTVPMSCDVQTFQIDDTSGSHPPG